MKAVRRLLRRAFLSPIKTSFKGAAGEAVLRKAAAISLPSSVYRRFHNVTLPTPNGTTQIDHVFVSRFGVFVVETKNMAGWIFGSDVTSNRKFPICGNAELHS